MKNENQFIVMSKIVGYYEINDIIHDIINKFCISIEVFATICIVAKYILYKVSNNSFKFNTKYKKSFENYVKN
jgi:hypothetical protein